MKRITFFVLNVLANVATLALCPLLVLAWIVRVRVLEHRARHPSTRAMLTGRRTARSHNESNVWWTMFGGSGG